MPKKDFIKLEEILRHISFIIKVEGRKVLNDYSDISKTMFEFLQIIYFSKQIGGKKLSDIFDVSKAAVSEILKKLETLDYVKKKVNPKDKREILYIVTEKGNNVIQKVIKKRVEFLEKVVSKEELKQLLPTLKNIMKNIENCKNINEPSKK